MDFRDELGRISLPDTVRVPTPFQANVQHVDVLSDTAFMSIYGEAQLILRTLAEQANIWGHSARQEYGDDVMGLVNPYWLCRQGLRTQFAPDELLKMIYLLGTVDPRGTVEVDVRQALSPYTFQPELRPDYVPPDHPRYWEWRAAEELADNNWWREKRSQYPDLRIGIFVLQQRFMGEKYGGHIRQACEPITHDRFPWRQEMDAEQWWHDHKREVGL